MHLAARETQQRIQTGSSASNSSKSSRERQKRRTTVNQQNLNENLLTPAIRNVPVNIQEQDDSMRNTTDGAYFG